MMNNVGYYAVFRSLTENYDITVFATQLLHVNHFDDPTNGGGWLAINTCGSICHTFPDNLFTMIKIQTESERYNRD